VSTRAVGVLLTTVVRHRRHQHAKARPHNEAALHLCVSGERLPGRTSNSGHSGRADHLKSALITPQLPGSPVIAVSTHASYDVSTDGAE